MPEGNYRSILLKTEKKYYASGFSGGIVFDQLLSLIITVSAANCLSHRKKDQT